MNLMNMLRSPFNRTIRPRIGLRVAAGLVMSVAIVAAGAGVASAASAHHFPGGLGRPTAAGEVLSAPTTTGTGSTFTISSRGQTVTVDVSGTTNYVEQSTPSPSVGDVGVGDFVALYGTESGTTVTATEVNIFVPKSMRPAPVVAGTVEATPAVDATDFLIMTLSGTTVTVDVSSTTTYFETGLAAATLLDVSQGESVVIFGTGTSPTVTASEVAIHRAPFVSAGTVTSTTGLPTSFTITTWNSGTLTVDVSAGTIYTQFGSTVTIAAITDGARVGVFGTTSGTTATAGEIVIAEPKPTGAFVATGTVTGTTGLPGDFTVQTCNGTTITVDLSGSTIYAEYGNTNPTYASVTDGEFVSVFGTESGTTATASEVVIAGNNGQGLFGFGHGHRSFGRFGFGGPGNSPQHGIPGGHGHFQHRGNHGGHWGS
jgi:hypothetical protein